MIQKVVFILFIFVTACRGEEKPLEDSVPPEEFLAEAEERRARNSRRISS